MALADIDEVIRVIRSSKTQQEAKARLMGIEAAAALMQRALGDDGFAVFQSERGVSETYTLTPVQADAILRMTLGQLVNLEQEKLAGEHRELLGRDQGIPADSLGREEHPATSCAADCLELKRKHGDDRRTEISGEEIGTIDLEDLITEETMVVTISRNGYIKRTAGQRLSRAAPRRQRPDGRQDRRRRPDPEPVCRQHARLSVVLHEPGQGVLAEGLRPAAAWAARAAAARW